MLVRVSQTTTVCTATQSANLFISETSEVQSLGAIFLDGTGVSVTVTVRDSATVEGAGPPVAFNALNALYVNDQARLKPGAADSSSFIYTGSSSVQVDSSLYGQLVIRSLTSIKAAVRSAFSTQTTTRRSGCSPI